MAKKRSAGKGFTLMEMLIVVAIIGILIAVSIPVFSSLLERSREATCMANRRSLKAVLTLSQLSGERESAEGTNLPLSEAEAKEYRCPSGGTITYSFFNDYFTVNCSKHRDKTISDSMTGILSSITAISQANHTGGIIDSTAGTQSVAQVAEALRKEGIDLAAMGATSWRYETQGGGKQFFYWTDQDITAAQAGSKVPVLRYNCTSGTYTVWYAKISNERGYNIISTPGGSDIYPACGSAPAAEQTYENAVAWLAAAQASQ